MSNEELRGLRRLAEVQGDSASWSRLAAALLRVERYDDAGEALVRARAVGVADPTVEDALEEASLEDAVLGHYAAGEGLHGDLAWFADSRRVLLHSNDVLMVADGPSWTVGRITNLDRRAVFAIDLEGRTALAFENRYVEGLGPPFNARLSIDLETGRTLELVRVDEGPGSIALWGDRDVIVASDGQSVQRFVRDQREPTLVHRSSRITLCWNGDVADWTAEECWLVKVPGSKAPQEFIRNTNMSKVRLRNEQTRASFPTLRAAKNYAQKVDVLLKVRTLDRPLSGIAVSPSGRFVATFAEEEPTVEIVDLVLGKARSFRTQSTPRHAVWAPNGRRLVVALVEGLAIVELGADPHASLDSQWRAAISDDRHDDAAFFERLVTDARPTVTEWLTRQLEPEPDEPSMPFRVASAARALAKRAQPVDLARVKRARERLPARSGGFRDYRGAVDHLIRVLEAIERGERCACSAGFLRPADHGSLEEQSADRREGSTIFVYACAICRRRWRVIEDTSFHFPTFEVQEIRE